MSKVIVRVKGGLGNQLFCYAAARRLALVNDAELGIDDVTGFVRDVKYRRKYTLTKFNIKARKATPAERLEPFEHGRRGVAKFFAKCFPFYRRRYVEQETVGFDARLLNFKVRGTISLDGYWQSEKYFKDVEEIIRGDLQITPPQDSHNRNMAQQIQGCEAVAIHVRWVKPSGGERKPSNVLASYYQRAIDEIERKVTNPNYFLFSDDSVSARSLLEIPDERLTCVSCNRGEENSYADLWLMSLCKHFIIANSTFSWWGAWLSGHESKLVITPCKTMGTVTCGGIEDWVPNGWVAI